jgi:uncharacterized protein YecE (DUF72 family)
MKRDSFFFFYQEQFSTVELNTTFYHFPREKQVETWVKRSREDFLFSVKAPRRITHVKQLNNCREDLLLFLHLIKPLRDSQKLGAILFQTPPTLRADEKRVKSFLELLPSGYSYCFEFRNRDFYREEFYSILQEKGVDFASVSELGGAPFDDSIAPFKYFRMHGPGQRYASCYTEQELGQLFEKIIKTWDKGRREVFVYFNNDYQAFAALNAIRLKEMVQSV